MGHACTKDDNAERVERRRMERERRLGLVRNVPPAQQVRVPLTPNGMWPRGPRYFQTPQLPAENNRITVARGCVPARQFQQAQNSTSARDRTPERRGFGNPNSPFNDLRHQPQQIQSQRESNQCSLQNDSSFSLKPIVVQALNQLCAIELQARVHIINDELWAMSDIMNELEHIQEMESFRSAGRELLALEARSRVSVLGQEEYERAAVIHWSNELFQEARLATLIRETQDRHARSQPSSQAGTPVRHHGRQTTSAPRPHLGWVADESVARLHRPVEARCVSPLREHQQSSVDGPRFADYSRVSETADRMVSFEEDALNAKIARQRGLIDSTRSLYRRPLSIDESSQQHATRATPIRAAPVAPQARVAERPSRPAPRMLNGDSELHADPHNHSSGSLRDASYMATKSRISALAHYQ